MPYRPSLGGLDYYKTGLSVATGDSRWLKLSQATPQTISGGAPIFSSGLKISSAIIDTRTTEDTALPLVTARNGVITGMFYQHGSMLNRDFLDWYLSNALMFRIARNQDGSTPGVTFFAPFNLSGYTLFGNGATAGNLTLVSADAGTKGKIYFGAALTSYYDEANNAWQLGSAPLSTTGNVDLGGQLLLEDVSANVNLFSNATVSDTTDGYSFYVYRKANEGTSYIRKYINQYDQAYMISNVFLTIQSAGGVVLDASTGAGSNVLIKPKVSSTYFARICGNFDVGGNTMGNNWFRQYGYITAGGGEKYVQWLVNDTTDKFELTRLDTSILAFDVQMPFSATTITTTSYATLGTIRSDYWQSAGAEVLIQNFGGLEILPGGLTGSDSALFFDQIASGKSPNIKIYNYITAASAVRYAKLAVDDSDDYFHLSRQDANILGFKIDMPISTASAFSTSSDINAGSTSVFYFGDSATDGTWRIVRDSNNLSFQRRESGAYVEKGKYQP